MESGATQIWTFCVPKGWRSKGQPVAALTCVLWTGSWSVQAAERHVSLTAMLSTQLFSCVNTCNCTCLWPECLGMRQRLHSFAPPNPLQPVSSHNIARSWLAQRFARQAKHFARQANTRRPPPQRRAPPAAAPPAACVPATTAGCTPGPLAGWWATGCHPASAALLHRRPFRRCPPVLPQHAQ